MHYAFMTFSTPQLTAEEIVRLALDLGYDGVEPRISAGHKHGLELDTPAEQRAALARQFWDAGVNLCCLATSCRYADPQTLRANVEETRRAIDLAADVGVPCVRVFGGRIGGGLSRAQAVEQVAGALASLADQAQQAGTTLCMETHDDWCDPDHVAAVMKKANHDNVAVNWDIMHPVRSAGKTIDQAFETLRTWIKHVHLHDGKDVNGQPVLQPIGQGVIDHRRAMELLMHAGYGGFLSGEWIEWEPYATHLPRELDTLKTYEAELRAKHGT